jgi:hypothetical protein
MKIVPALYNEFKNTMNKEIEVHREFKSNQDILDKFEFQKIDDHKKDDEFLAYFFSDNPKTKSLRMALVLQLVYGSHNFVLEGEQIRIFNMVNEMFVEMERIENETPNDNIIDIEITEEILNRLFDNIFSRVSKGE